MYKKESMKRLAIRYWRNEVPSNLSFRIEKYFGFGTGHKCIQSNDYLFIHVPKAAGSSISKALYGKKIPHFKALEFEKHYKNFNTKYKFAFVRNPLDRAISCYNFLSTLGTQQVTIHKGYKYKTVKDLTFEEFTNVFLTDDSRYKDVTLLKQADFVTNSTGNIIVDDIYKFEDFDCEIKRLSKNIGINLKVGNDNISKKRNDVVITEIAKKNVEEYYKIDYELFGY